LLELQQRHTRHSKQGRLQGKTFRRAHGTPRRRACVKRWPQLGAPPVSADTLLRVDCENVEPIVSRDEATEHSSRVVFQHCCPLQLFWRQRYLGHERMTIRVQVRGDMTC
jgi:hypothetical protein